MLEREQIDGHYNDLAALSLAEARVDNGGDGHSSYSASNPYLRRRCAGRIGYDDPKEGH
jgi:hypothetical protein